MSEPKLDQGLESSRWRYRCGAGISSLNTQTNLQSCGGCWGEGNAVDCTLLLADDDHNGTVACIDGMCQGECSLKRHLALRLWRLTWKYFLIDWIVNIQ
jgi:hypothetical protein